MPAVRRFAQGDAGGALLRFSRSRFGLSSRPAQERRHGKRRNALHCAQSATQSSIALGEAALALDPLSSSGVQKAIQTSLSGAIVANTLIRKPASAATAMEFYRTSLEETSTRHLAWTAGYYAQAAQTGPHPSGKRAPRRDRSRRRTGAQPQPLPIVSPHNQSNCRASRIAEIPCIEGEFVTLKPAFAIRGLPGPSPFSAISLAPLSSAICPPVLRSSRLRRSRSQRMPFKSALSIALWLRHNGILFDHAEARP